MGFYNQFPIGGRCDCDFGFEGGFPFNGDYALALHGGCLCHCCRIKQRCKWWRRRFS